MFSCVCEILYFCFDLNTKLTWLEEEGSNGCCVCEGVLGVNRVMNLVLKLKATSGDEEGIFLNFMDERG